MFTSSAPSDTETAPAVTFASWRLDKPGVIGIPLPGVALKFLPNGGKLEMRVKGPNITPGYRGNEEATRSAFDEDGYYCIGDAGFLADEHGGRANAQHKGANVNGATKEDLAEVFDLYFSQNQTDIFCFKAGIEDAEDAFATFEKPYW